MRPHVVVHQEASSVLQGDRIGAGLVVGQAGWFHLRRGFAPVSRPGCDQCPLFAAGQDLQLAILVLQATGLDDGVIGTAVDWTYFPPGFTLVIGCLKMNTPPRATFGT